MTKLTIADVLEFAEGYATIKFDKNYIVFTEEDAVKFANNIHQQAHDAGAMGAVKTCIEAVDDAGGDNTHYHIDAIRARTEVEGE